MKKDFPLYYLEIDEENDSLVNAIAIVEQPAIMKSFLAFSKDKIKSNFFDSKNASNEDKMELIGAAMIPEMAIERVDFETGETFYVKFSASTIRKISQTFFKNKFNNNLNVEHDATKDAKSYVFQSYIVDEYTTAKFDESLPLGTWVVGVKVNDVELWDKIKKGDATGFSIEGLFDLVDMNLTHNPDEEDDEELIKAINEFTDAFNKYNSIK